MLRPLLASAAVVVRLQSGHGLDDLDLVAAGAKCTVGIDFGEVAAAAAKRRASSRASSPPLQARHQRAVVKS